MATKKFSDAWLRSLAPAPAGQRREWIDAGGTGLAVTVNAKRRITFSLVARYPRPDGTRGLPTRAVLGDYRPVDTKGQRFEVKAGVPVLTLEEARRKVTAWKEEIAAGRDPRPNPRATDRPQAVVAEPAPDTIGNVFDDYLRRHVKKEGQKDARGKPVPPLRSAAEIERIFDRYVLEDPDGKDRWRNRPIGSIRRRDVTELLDDIQDRNGAVQADAVLAQLSAMFNWYASRGDDFLSPIVRGMKRSRPKERARKRVLSDEEIGVFWQACGQEGTFGALCRVALLTGQRREKITQMRWENLSSDGLWTISSESREKSNAQFLRLPKLALDVIRAQPRTPSRPYVFQGRLKGPINGFSRAKAKLDARMEEIAGQPIEPWVLHDLRRTSKSLMIRAGVSPHDSERVLGHQIPGVEGVYDRHDYLGEKSAALRKLAALVTRIIQPPSNVVAMKRRARR